MIKHIKEKQLGINLSTARNRLLKDILFSLLVETGKDTCYRCKNPLSKEDFSIEHITPWLHSANPTDLYFDLNNISFSHMHCNTIARRPRQAPNHGTASKYAAGCRCDKCVVGWRLYKKERYDPKKRSNKYRKRGT